MKWKHDIREVGPFSDYATSVVTRTNTRVLCSFLSDCGASESLVQSSRTYLKSPPVPVSFLSSCRRRIFTDWPEHRGDLPGDKQFHHLRRLDDHSSVLWDGHVDPDEQARVSDAHAGELEWAKPNKLEHDCLSSRGIACLSQWFSLEPPCACV